MKQLKLKNEDVAEDEEDKEEDEDDDDVVAL